MQFSRENLTNFDLYPFTTIACDSDGFVIYKNELTRKLYRNIHVGAKLSTYTNAALSPSRIEVADFYGERCTMFICSLEDNNGIYTIITIFSIGSCGSDLYKNSITELETAVTSLLSSNESGDVLKKRSLLRDIVKKHELAKRCGAFASSYLENTNLFSFDFANVTDFISRIVTIINDRLEIDVTIDICDLTKCTPYIKITKGTVLVMLNFLNFAILNSDKNVTITLSNTGNEVNISFEYHSKHIFENIFTDNNALCNTFMLLTGINVAEQNNGHVSITNKNGRSSVDAYFPLIIPKDMTFKSTDNLNEMIEEYIKLSHIFFKD